jgi:hypothetical protein
MNRNHLQVSQSAFPPLLPTDDHLFRFLIFNSTERNNLSFIETSALDSTNVETAFQNILTGWLSFTFCNRVDKDVCVVVVVDWFMHLSFSNFLFLFEMVKKAF